MVRAVKFIMVVGFMVVAPSVQAFLIVNQTSEPIKLFNDGCGDYWSVLMRRGNSTVQVGKQLNLFGVTSLIAEVKGVSHEIKKLTGKTVVIFIEERNEPVIARLDIHGDL